MLSFIRAALLIGLAVLVSSPAFAQSTLEKGKATGRNRVTEVKDAVVDEAHAVKDRVDSDSK